MELKTRRVHFAGCTTSPNEDWIKQVARELTNYEDGFLIGKQSQKTVVFCALQKTLEYLAIKQLATSADYGKRRCLSIC
jgi:hypothetical protein